MKANKLLLGLMASGLAFAGLTQSCVSDEPFADADGEGTLRLQLMVNSNLTRAEMNDNQLLDSCVVYISNPAGLLYKFKGADQIPETISLKYGSYVAEAWTGDSVPASFSSRFYRGYQPFSIEDSGYETVQIPCRIANVAVNVDPTTVTDDMLTEWKVTVNNSSGSLVFDASNAADSIGYFMMPKADYAYVDGALKKGSDGWPMFTNLYYKVEGKTAAGENFVKTGPIGSKDYEGKYVEHAHLYTLSFEYHPEFEDKGGSVIEIKINEEEIEVREEVGLYSRPAIKGVNFDIAKQIIGSDNGFAQDMIVKVAGFNGLTSVVLSSDDPFVSALLGGGVDIRNIASNIEDSFKQEYGLDWDYSPKAKEVPSISYIHFMPLLLNKLTEREEEYVINIHAVDGNGRESDASVRIAIGEGAVIPDAMVQLDAINSDTDPMAVLYDKATITGSFLDDAVNPELKYRKASDLTWQSVDLTATRGSRSFSVTLTGLEPDTQYVCKAAADGWEGDEISFRTEAAFKIPFGDMEDWATHTDKAPFPGDNYATNFWDSGNHGSVSFNTTILTNKSADMKHSGSYSAKLQSQYVGLGGALGKFAAGNLFVGKFGATVGTSGAQLVFGQPYNGSHPSKLSVWVSYTPSVVDYTNSKCPHTFAKNSDLDHGQIYVAFATEPIAVNTSTSEKNGVPANTFMNFQDPRIIGFGEVNWEGTTCGSSSSLEHVEIPIEWREAAKTHKATTMIIVCSASKYGDYFTGGSKSVMYVDDFELVY